VDDASDYIERINAAVAADDLPAAAALAEVAIKAGVRHPMLIRLVAEDLERRGEGPKAVDLLRRGLVLIPGDPVLLTALGRRLINLQQISEAVRMFDAATKADPNAWEAHYGLATALAGEGMVDASRWRFERVLEIRPDFADARAGLAMLLARTGETAAAREQAERALADFPGHIVATIALALAEIGAREFEAAEARIRALLEIESLGPADRATAERLLGDALDGQHRAAEAFAVYSVANETFKTLYADKLWAASADTPRILSLLEDLFGREQPQRWTAVERARGEPPPPAAGHAFLVGFPRSGTTLLEQILAAHPAVEALEEQPTLAKAENEFLRSAEGVQRLASLDPEAAARYRRIYWNTVANTGGAPEGKLFVDKMPMSSISLPVVAKLFPGAKVLFARRDPRDVILSCFRRAFKPNVATYAMLTLEGGARLYDGVMRLTDVYRKALPIEVYEVRYERLVADFEGEARAIFDFLGLEWSPQVNEFAAKAATRTVKTPSAIQVRRGIYREGAGQWRRYRDQLAPVLPMLAPWIEPKGYPAE
jgi:Flp pilus assembly protein TadD